MKHKHQRIKDHAFSTNEILYESLRKGTKLLDFSTTKRSSSPILKF